jgi:uncharacterized membrane protein
MSAQEPYDVIAVSFTHDAAAEHALGLLRRAEEADLLSIENAAVIVKDDTGAIELAEMGDKSGWQGLASGLLIGGLLGLILPGRTVISSALKSGPSRAFIERLRDTGFEDDDLREIAESIPIGGSMLVAIVRYEHVEEVQALMRAGSQRMVTARLTSEV